MSGYYYPQGSSADERAYDFDQAFTTQATSGYPSYQYATASAPSLSSQQQFYNTAPQYYQHPPQFHPFSSTIAPQQQWVQPTVPSNHSYTDQSVTPFPQYSEAAGYRQATAISGPSRTSTGGLSRTSTGHLSPDEAMYTRVSRSTSFASNASSLASYSEASRSVSPNMSEMLKYGTRNDDGRWSCAYPGCSSQTRFTRGCDLRKHYKRHTKSLFCRWEGCPQASEGGFSSKKDRLRHEAKHNPSITCEWEGCDRLFSRQDNMVSPS